MTCFQASSLASRPAPTPMPAFAQKMSTVPNSRTAAANNAKKNIGNNETSVVGNNASSPAGRGSILDDKQAYDLFNSWCSTSFARGFKLYKLYERAAAFSGQPEQ